jgi:hypothetical protein
MHDLLAVKNLARSTGYAAAFILTLGLGIDANTAIFSAAVLSALAPRLPLAGIPGSPGRSTAVLSPASARRVRALQPGAPRPERPHDRLAVHPGCGKQRDAPGAPAALSRSRPSGAHPGPGRARRFRQPPAGVRDGHPAGADRVVGEAQRPRRLRGRVPAVRESGVR